MCKGANAAKPRAKVQRWIHSFQVAGGGPGWQVAGRVMGRAVIAIAAVRSRRRESRRVLAKRVVAVRPLANGRDGNHVPT
jgi:hypothetical protein